MEWTDFDEDVPPLTQERRKAGEVTNIFSDNIPVTGETRTVRVKLPFEEEPGNEFYFDYHPASVYHRWFVTGDDLERSAAVKCRFEKIISADEYSAWIKVKVLDVIMFRELTEVFPAYRTELSLEEFDTMCSCDETEIDDPPWQSKYWTAESDITETKAFYTDKNGIRHLVWLTIDDFFTHISYFGNITN